MKNPRRMKANGAVILDNRRRRVIGWRRCGCGKNIKEMGFFFWSCVFLAGSCGVDFWMKRCFWSYVFLAGS